MATLRPLKIMLLLVFFFLLLIVGFWMGGLFSEARKAGVESRSESRFAQIRAMLLLYHEQHGHFPPTKYQPKAGGPVHSWRVLLIPHTGMPYQERYSKYDFNQEWNSSNNLQVLAGMPYFDYFKIGSDGDFANYLAIGENDEWPSEKPLKARLVSKGNDRFLVVEYPDSKIRWMEPKY